MKQRELYLDTLAGFFIVLMIFNHICQHTHFENSLIYIWLGKLFFFFMPWFFFKAGLFNSKRSLREEAKHLQKKVLFPFVVFTIVGYIINLLRLDVLSSISVNDIIWSPIIDFLFMGSIYGNLPLWFLLSFYMVKIVQEFCMEKKYNSLYLCAFSLVIAYLMNLASIHIFKHIPYYLGNIPLGVSFMAISSFLQRYKQSAWILIVTIPLWLLNVFYFESFLDFRSNALLSGNYFMFYLSSVAGIISVNYIMRFIEFKKSIIFDAVLSYIGKNSLSFFILHWLIILLVELIVGLVGVQEHLLVAIFMTLGCMTIIPLYIRFKFNDLLFNNSI